ncbi:MAG: PASTA domain-containing protein [Fimbriimonadales bacterium]|nr:PASTA domain-containing protein [Fimbriimonadales bacterium]
MIGQVLASRYEVLEKGPEHPLFTVYFGRDRLRGSDVSLKVFREPFCHEPEFLQAAFEACRVSVAVVHPSLERTLALETDPSGAEPPFLVAERAKGQPLRERIRKMVQLSPQLAVAIAVSVCEGLAALHESGFVHGDVSAENAFVTPDGQATLLNANLWRSYPKSRTAGVVALPAMAPYLAPEISRGAMPSPQTDVYAVGILLFEMLTGSAPFRAESPVAVAMMHASESVPSPKERNQAIPQFLDQIVRKCLQKAPESRYPDASALLADLRRQQDAMKFGRNPRMQRPPATTAAPAPAKGVPASPRSPRADGVWTPTVEPAIDDDRVPKVLMVLMALFGALAAVGLGWWLLYNLAKPKFVEVPNLVGMTVNVAREAVAPSKLRILVTARRPSEQYPADVILEVSPEPGQKVKEGSPLTVVVSSGSRFVQVPDLRGYTVDAARTLLQSLNLRLDDRVRTVRSDDQPEGTIVGQEPEAGAKVEQGSALRVRVSGAAAAEALSEAPVWKRSVRLRLSRLNAPVVLRVDLTDDQGTRTIHEDLHQPDEVVELLPEVHGEKGTLEILYDGKTVQTVELTRGGRR